VASDYQESWEKQEASCRRETGKPPRDARVISVLRALGNIAKKPQN